MTALGLGRGDVVGTIGDNRPDWVAAEIATHAIGGLSLGLYRDALEEEVGYLLNYGETKLVFAEDEQKVDKLLGLGRPRAAPASTSSIPTRAACGNMTIPRLIEADQARRPWPRTRRQGIPALYDRLVDATRGDAAAILCTTSGTTVEPEARHALRARPCVAPIARHILHSIPRARTTEYVSVLPLPWIMEQVYVLGKGLLCRMKVNFVEARPTP